MSFYMPNNFIDGIINRALATDRARIVEQNRVAMPMTDPINSSGAVQPVTGVVNSPQPSAPGLAMPATNPQGTAAPVINPVETAPSIRPTATMPQNGAPVSQPGLMPRPGNQFSMPLGGIPNIAK